MAAMLARLSTRVTPENGIVGHTGLVTTAARVPARVDDRSVGNGCPVRRKEVVVKVAGFGDCACVKTSTEFMFSHSRGKPENDSLKMTNGDLSRSGQQHGLCRQNLQGKAFK
jgi:hypothetical protein